MKGYLTRRIPTLHKQAHGCPTSSDYAQTKMAKLSPIRMTIIVPHLHIRV